MPNKMLIDASHPEETRVVVVRGNRIEEFDFESQDKKQLKGNIYLARVTRVEPSLQAAFVEYGGNRHGFLAFSEIHPDYYQIPVADRQALLRAEAEAAEAEDDEDGDGEERDDRNRGRRAGAAASAAWQRTAAAPSAARGFRSHARRRGRRRQIDDEAEDGGDLPPPTADAAKPIMKAQRWRPDGRSNGRSCGAMPSIDYAARGGDQPPRLSTADEDDDERRKQAVQLDGSGDRRRRRLRIAAQPSTATCIVRADRRMRRP